MRVGSPNPSFTTPGRSRFQKVLLAEGLVLDSPVPALPGFRVGFGAAVTFGRHYEKGTGLGLSSHGGKSDEVLENPNSSDSPGKLILWIWVLKEEKL